MNTLSAIHLCESPLVSSVKYFFAVTLGFSMSLQQGSKSSLLSKKSSTSSTKSDGVFQQSVLFPVVDVNALSAVDVIQLLYHTYGIMSTLNIYSSVIRMKLIDGCHSLKLECALRELGFVDVGWKCVANAGIFLVLPFGLPEKPEGDLLGFQVVKSSRVIRLSESAKKALDFAITMSG